MQIKVQAADPPSGLPSCEDPNCSQHLPSGWQHPMKMQRFKTLSVAQGVLAGWTGQHLLQSRQEARPVNKAGVVTCLVFWRGVPIGVDIMAVAHAVHDGRQKRGRMRHAADEAVHIGAPKTCSEQTQCRV